MKVRVQCFSCKLTIRVDITWNHNVGEPCPECGNPYWERIAATHKGKEIVIRDLHHPPVRMTGMEKIAFHHLQRVLNGQAPLLEEE